MKFLKILAAVIYMYSCNSGKVSTNYFDKICLKKDSFKIDTSRGSYSSSTIINDNLLNIKPISVPSDTFFFRVQSTYDTTLQIFEYSFYNSKSTYKIYKFKVNYKSGKILFNKDNDDIRKFETVFDPKKKGNDFIAQLESNNILDLPDSHNIPNYPYGYGQTAFLIEYSNKCRYNIFIYNNPYQYSKKFREAKALINFLDYLKKEFCFLK